MVTVEELVVKATPQGVDNVNDDLNEMEKNFENTANNVEDTSRTLGGLTRKFKGAMTAIIGGLAIGVAGVLSQVPVLGEAVDGVKSVFQALGLQIDKKLRPFMGKLSNEFYDLSAAISEGDYDKAKKEIKDIINLFKNINFGEILNNTITGIQELFSGIDFEKVSGKMIDFRDELTNKVIDDISNFADKLKVKDVEKATEKFIRVLKDSIFSAIKNVDWVQLLIAIAKLIGKITVGVAKAVKDEIVDPLVNTIEEKFQTAIEVAKQWGKDLIEKIIDGVQSKSGELSDAVSDIKIAGDVTIGDVAGTVPGAFDGGNNTSGGSAPASGTGAQPATLDGRSIEDNQGRYRAGNLNRRGI